MSAPTTNRQSQTPDRPDIRRSVSAKSNITTSQPKTSSVTSTTSTPRINGRLAEGPISSVLPHEKVFPVQIGCEVFRLSGASISSDGAPSYFTQFFEEQIKEDPDGAVRTLYIDRDPSTFRDIAQHLQGYHIKPRDGSHFVRLFADAQFYSLPRLISQLFESEIFIQIGDGHFQVPRDIFSNPGDSPNFFSLGFAVFFSTPGEAFPGLDPRGLLRPPTIVPPSVPNRSATVFAQLLHLLRGYPLHIRNEDHRQELLRDCRYFHLRGLEQKLIPYDISYNLQRQRSEIVIRLEDVRPSGVSIAVDNGPDGPTGGWVNYARPFVDERAHELIIEIGGESTMVDLQSMRADFQGSTKARIASLTQVVANKLNLPNNAPLGLLMLSGGASSQGASPGNTPLSEDRVKVRIDHTADLILDNEPFEGDWYSKGGTSELNLSELDSMDIPVDSPLDGSLSNPPSAKRPAPSIASDTRPYKKQKFTTQGMIQWSIRRGLWRLRVQSNPSGTSGSGLEIIFVAVKLEAFNSERGRNANRKFLN